MNKQAKEVSQWQHPSGIVESSATMTERQQMQAGKATRTRSLASLMSALDVLRAESGSPDIQAQTIQCFLAVALRSEVPMSQIQEAIGMSQASVSRNVARLGRGLSPKEAGLGWVESFEDPWNRRTRIVRVTARGRVVADRVAEAAAKYVGGQA